MLEVNGKNYIRVSDVARIQGQFDHIPKDVLERKAALGTAVHKSISEEIQGNFPIVKGQECGYFNSFKRWEEMICPEFTCSEVRYCCDKKCLTGCIDALVKLEGEKEAILVDFKTSAQESPITWPMQAHLYYYLLRKNSKKVSKKFMFLKLDRYGHLPKIFIYKFDIKLMKKCLQMVDEYGAT